MRTVSSSLEENNLLSWNLVQGAKAQALSGCVFEALDNDLNLIVRQQRNIGVGGQEAPYSPIPIFHRLFARALPAGRNNV